MRLIDAEELLKGIKEATKSVETERGEERIKIALLDCLAIVMEAVARMETAYDIDKVVEEIMEAYGCHNCEQCDTMACNECAELEVLKDICEIVKQGGASDDVCEWKQGERFRGMETLKTGCCGKTMVLTALEAADINDCLKYAMKYCPYCGKKIKVVE